MSMGRTSDARERLLASGLELMYDKGYTAVGVSEVCAKAGVNKGSFYYFYPSKQQLGLAIVDEHAVATQRRLQALVAGDAPAVDRLRSFFVDSYRFHKAVLAEHGKVMGCPLGNLALEMSTQDETLRDRVRGVLDAHAEAFEQVIEQAVDNGEIEPLDVGRTARGLLALLEGAVMLAKMHNDPEMLADLGEAAMQMLGTRS